MDKERLVLLEADIKNQQKQIENIYGVVLQRKRGDTRDPVVLESLAFHLHNLYCAFEDLFKKAADHFENQISNQTGWHRELLDRMRMPIPGIRPALISQPAYEMFNELRGFRHVFHHTYGFKLEPAKVKIVLRKAMALRKIYKKDISVFLGQLKASSKS